MKNELVQSRVFSSIVHSSRQPFSAHNNGENWTKWFFDDFRKWPVSRLLDHLWTSNKVYLEASTFLSTNMKKKYEFILRKFSKIQFSDCIVFFVTVCIETTQSYFGSSPLYCIMDPSVKNSAEVGEPMLYWNLSSVLRWQA